MTMEFMCDRYVMRIENNSNLCFSARVDNNFVNNALKFYSKRNMAIQSMNFTKFLDRFETYGSSDSRLVYYATVQNNQRVHALCLKNKRLNNKSALIVALSNKYTDLLKFFTNITDNMMLDWEDQL